MAAVATAKKLRGEDPDGVARLCSMLDEANGLLPGAWAAMVAGLADGEPIATLPSPEVVREVVDVSPSAPVDDPSIPFWMR